MDSYSGTQAVSVDPVEEWAAPGGETGLEEPMWQLGLGSGPESYPERPGEPDCIYYLRTGFCGYGNRCRFSHPRERSMAMGALRAAGGEYPERIGQPLCQYYMRTGMCKFGASCKYDHPKNGIGSSGPLALNISGYPLRPGERECSFYVKTGQCKFGITCKFHHPHLAAGVQAPPPGPTLAAPVYFSTPAVFPSSRSPSVQSSQQYGVIQGNWPVARPGSYVPGNYGPMLGVVPVPSWTPYPAPFNPMATPSTQPAVGANTIYMGPHLSATSAGPPSSNQKGHAFPERPDQLDCQYYLRTGNCKFGPTCKYHHPLEWSAQNTTFILSPMGLPLRPGAPLCSHYAQNGVCKFGPSCRFDHPITTLLSYSPSASSLTGMPIAPYPVGSTNATLAPSSDLRTQHLSGEMSSMNSLSASVGSIFSTSGPAHQSTVQQSGQGSISLSVDSSKNCGGSLHTSS